MSNPPKYVSYPVNDLTDEQLRSEWSRCKMMLRAISSGPALKGLKKRLHQVERRIERERREREAE
jgi:hypothetical protein